MRFSSLIPPQPLRFCAALLALGGSLLAPAQAARPVILAYHQVGVNTGPTLHITPAELRERVLGLRALGYRFVTASEAAQAGPEARVAVMQFDDGYASVYEQAFPVLRELGVPGSAFVIWQQVGQPGYMTAAQLRELRAAGWEIGHHTLSHTPLSRLSGAELRRALQPREGAGCVAYPYNLQDARVRRAAREQGLSCGITGGPYLPQPDPLALSAPALTPWDGQFLSARARYGLGGRTPLLVSAALLPVFDASAAAPAAPPPLTWNPAGYELLGNGSLSFSVGRGSVRETRLATRWGGNDAGDWVAHVAARRGSARYNGFGVAYHRSALTVGGGWDTAGPLLAGSVALGQAGEVWGRWHPYAPAAEGWAVGANIVPESYWNLYVAHSPDASVLGLTYWLPGGKVTAVRPWQIGGGLRREQGQRSGFVSAAYAAGSYTLGGELDTAGRWNLRFGAQW